MAEGLECAGGAGVGRSPGVSWGSGRMGRRTGTARDQVSSLWHATQQALEPVRQSFTTMGRKHPVRRIWTIVLLIGILGIPALAAFSAYQDYQQLRTLGEDAVHHLLAAKDALIPSKSAGTGSGSC